MKLTVNWVRNSSLNMNGLGISMQRLAEFASLFSVLFDISQFEMD